jgi:hypothetical protein
LYFITLTFTNVFAANGIKGDCGFGTKAYKYALIEGEVTSIDPDKKNVNCQWF